MEIKNRSNGNSDWRSQQDCFGILPGMPPLVPRNDARAVHMAPAEGGRGFSLGEPVIASDGQAMRGCAKQSPRDEVRNDEAQGMKRCEWSIEMALASSVTTSDVCI